ncbi:hypothetical protein VOLCADRAFT_121722 [Volvox carteri f. nagariensis]|uniref:Uncharacterized protein n=1 Tax=Volvox carteri f. nagariensis TaxID=3068 RepID=D8UII6_VOLCA|nr:uncharacterized protein VOLCADRAFT_121722 [Volvox carteri f. nagariensis]EFJ40482.1 hypothetical protein VOLCADRAFT_121722 [Volvox carteri f. nagariensis]|eukprot:XP_002958482.1 hypothetical protein VOLCADRAFT_121722 [Volvox carteri f. nagariensis]
MAATSHPPATLPPPSTQPFRHSRSPYGGAPEPYGDPYASGDSYRHHTHHAGPYPPPHPPPGGGFPRAESTTRVYIPSTVHVAPPKIQMQPWARKCWRWLVDNTTGVARVDLRRPTPVYGPVYGQTYPAASSPTGTLTMARQPLLMGRSGGAKESGKPLLDVGMGINLDVDQQEIQPVARIKIKDLVSIKVAPMALLKISRSIPLGPVALKCMSISPQQCAVQVLQFGSSVSLRTSASLLFPRQLPLEARTILTCYARTAYSSDGSKRGQILPFKGSVVVEVLRMRGAHGVGQWVPRYRYKEGVIKYPDVYYICINSCPAWRTW